MLRGRYIDSGPRGYTLLVRARETLLDTLDRWELHGATWRIVELSDARAAVELRTCHGEPVERVESADPDVIGALRERDASAPAAGS